MWILIALEDTLCLVRIAWVDLFWSSLLLFSGSYISTIPSTRSSSQRVLSLLRSAGQSTIPQGKPNSLGLHYRLCPHRVVSPSENLRRHPERQRYTPADRQIELATPFAAVGSDCVKDRPRAGATSARRGELFQKFGQWVMTVAR